MKAFKFEQTTTASKAAIWGIWMDVANWHQWDTELISAEASSALTLHTIGTLQPKTGPKSQFIVTELTDGESFTFQTKLPFATLDVAHYFTDSTKTTFVHEVIFGGPLAFIFSRVLGGTFRKALPGVLVNIQQIAESAEIGATVA